MARESTASNWSESSRRCGQDGHRIRLVTEEAFETFAGKMIAGIKRRRSTASISVCTAPWRSRVLRPEAELARGFAKRSGEAFIAATFDLHGNEDEAFLRYADMAFR